MKGILFTEPMFRAVVAGQKTQTRRIVNPQPDPEYKRASMGMRLDKSKIIDGMFQKDGETLVITRKPKYQPGEVVYLKEPYKIGFDDDLPYYKYLTDLDHPGGIVKWKCKLFMPAKYARYFIRIKDVRVENVGDISKNDAISEGFNSKENFINVFTKINKLKIWDRPWVFAYTFELTSKPETSNQ